MKGANRFLLLFGLALAARTGVCQSPDGGVIYARNCNRCHNYRSPAERSDRDWDVAIGHMRIIANLSGADAQAVLRFLQKKNPTEASSVARLAESRSPALSGEQLVEQHACRACHVIRGTGGTVGPSLDSLFSRRDEQYVREQISSPTLHNPASVMPPHAFAPGEMDRLINYLHSAGK